MSDESCQDPTEFLGPSHKADTTPRFGGDCIGFTPALARGCKLYYGTQDIERREHKGRNKGN